MEEVLGRLKQVCKQSLLLFYIQHGDVVLFNPTAPIRTTRRWQLLQRRASGRDVGDADCDGAVALDKHTPGTWKWTAKQVEIYQTQVLPIFRELSALCSGAAGEAKDDECSFLVILQSPLDAEKREILSHNGGDAQALRLAQLKDGDHIHVEYRKEKGVGLFITTNSTQLRQCLILQYNGVLQQVDGSVLIKNSNKKKAVDAQIKCWQHAISSGARPIVLKSAATAAASSNTPTKRRKLDPPAN
jgi:hypothetical protein